MRVKVVMENDRVVVKILKSMLGVAFTPTWDGEFEPAYEVLPDQDNAVFSAMVKSYGMQVRQWAAYSSRPFDFLRRNAA